MTQTLDNNSTKRYWKSPEELVQDPEWEKQSQREFPQGASVSAGMDRREFVKLMGASMGLAGMTLSGCRRPETKILAYAKQPERLIPGVALHYASAYPFNLDPVPLIVETHEARPTKVEGNPSFTPYGGKSNSYAQASILDLYDPDRSQKSQQSGKSLSKEAVKDQLNALHEQLERTQGKGVAILAEPSSSFSRERMVDELKKRYPQLQWIEYAAIEQDGAERALERLFGKRLRPHYHFEHAKRILSVGGDFLGSMPGSIGYNQSFSKRRRVLDPKDSAEMNRLYVVEGNFTITGAAADHRLRLEMCQHKSFLALLAADIFRKTNTHTELLPHMLKGALNLESDPDWLHETANDLVENAGESLVVIGNEYPEELHWLVFAINDALRAHEKTLSYLEVPKGESKGLPHLSVEISEGKVDTLLILGGDPVYSAPKDVPWKALQEKVPNVIRWGYHFDQTSQSAKTHIAASHYLESWDDARAWNGTLLPVQPMIEPLFETFSELELLSHLLGQGQKKPYEWVRESFERLDKENYGFDRFLAQGVFPGYRYDQTKIEFNWKALNDKVRDYDFTPHKLSTHRLDLNFVPSYHMWDGRFINNAWLQECPDPITKLTWDNAILISPKLALELGIEPQQSVMTELGQSSPDANTFDKGKEQAPLGEIIINGSRVVGPLHVLPGLADYSVIMPLGYGRGDTGSLSEGSGFNVYPLTTVQNRHHLYGGRIGILEYTYPLANTQQHWSMEGRAIIREANLDEYKEKPDFAQKMGMESHSPPIYGKDQGASTKFKSTTTPRGSSMYETPAFKDPQQWGMVVDLNTCTGCNACVVACQAENNVPIVGKDQVLRGREMHWIRIDRYFSSNFDSKGNLDKQSLPQDPQLRFQPMMCQHCELAPCENVCPVAATVHDDQGLNVMAYQRCVGTRYCANNCPYKVRRFNFFDWNKRKIGHFYEGPLGPEGPEKLTQMQKNPNVTVRMRGVMEKCTMCVQRIEQAKQHQRVIARGNNDIKVPDKTIQTACQQVCPSSSIVFGDIIDSKTEVAQLRDNSRSYAVLGYLNTRPRVTYLAQVHNPNPLMPDYREMPLNRAEYELRYGHHSHHHGDDHGDTKHATKQGAHSLG